MESVLLAVLIVAFGAIAIWLLVSRLVELRKK